MIMETMYVLLVTGGYGGGSPRPLSSTEISTNLGLSWSENTNARLPGSRYSLTATTIDNTIFVFGGQHTSGYVYDSILKYNPSTQVMETVSKMTIARASHSTSVIDVDEDIQDAICS